MVTNPAFLFLPLLLPFQCAAPAWTQGLTTPFFKPLSLPSTTFIMSTSPLLTVSLPAPFSFQSLSPEIHINTCQWTHFFFLDANCIYLFYFLFQCEAVLWSYDVGPGDTDWRRLRLPHYLPFHVPHKPPQTILDCGFFFFYFLSFNFVFFLWNICPTFLCIERICRCVIYILSTVL